MKNIFITFFFTVALFGIAFSQDDTSKIDKKKIGEEHTDKPIDSQ